MRSVAIWCRRVLCATVVSVAFPLLGSPLPAHAANGDCGIPLGSGSTPKTSDCLYVLKAGVGTLPCAHCTCDTNGNGSIAASDALLCLKLAVGQSVVLACPPCTTTTTTLSTTTTSSSTTTTTTTTSTTTTTLPPTTTTSTTTTTLPPTTTTTTTTTSTTLPPSGSCPGSVQWLTAAGVGAACNSNADCSSGTCSGDPKACRSATELDLGWTGLAHNLDLGDASLLRVAVACGQGPVCGQCSVTGIDPSAGNCRCSNDSRRACDQPFQLNSDDCPACFGGAFVGGACASNQDCNAGSCAKRCANNLAVVCTKTQDCPGSTCGAFSKCSNGKVCTVDSQCIGTCTTGSLCQCFEGAPLPVSVGGLPLCMTQRFATNVTGTVNVSTGSSSLTKDLRATVYNGSSNISPCPVCGGKCSNNASLSCVRNSDCSGDGVCQLDPVVGDGVRGGSCVGGPSNGLNCDVTVKSTSYPLEPGLAGGGGYSLDCLPEPGSNISGAGIRTTVVEGTGQASLPADLSCGGIHAGLSCPCLVCSTDASVACRNNADCVAVSGTCSSVGPGGAQAEPNDCTDHLCSDAGAGEGTCSVGPDDLFCDGLVQANGRGVVPCAANVDCTIGVNGGNCLLLQRRSCFLDPIVATGSANSIKPTTAANFCFSAVSTAGRNAAVGLPGPGRLRRQTRMRSYCASAPLTEYIPGAGGCP